MFLLPPLKARLQSGDNGKECVFRLPFRPHSEPHWYDLVMFISSFLLFFLLGRSRFLFPACISPCTISLSECSSKSYDAASDTNMSFKYCFLCLQCLLIVFTARRHVTYSVSCDTLLFRHRNVRPHAPHSGVTVFHPRTQCCGQPIRYGHPT